MSDSETIYTSKYTPDPSSALDVLAFVLAPARAFVQSDDPEELDAVVQLLFEAKTDAIERWQATRLWPRSSR